MQALYDSEFSFTITRVRREGIDFALVSYMEYADLKLDDWHHVTSYANLAAALHSAALKQYAESAYARRQRGAA